MHFYCCYCYCCCCLYYYFAFVVSFFFSSRFSVRCGPSNAKGIHIREGVLKKPYEYNVNIEPKFFNETEAGK